jgi:hypothetical protein
MLFSRKLLLLKRRNWKLIFKWQTVQGCKLTAPQTTISGVSEQAFNNLREQNNISLEVILTNTKGLPDTANELHEQPMHNVSTN